jgi:hypothetical protein
MIFIFLSLAGSVRWSGPAEARWKGQKRAALRRDERGGAGVASVSSGQQRYMQRIYVDMRNGSKLLCIAILLSSGILPISMASASASSFIDDPFGLFDHQEREKQAANPYGGTSTAKGCFVSYSQIEVVKGIRHWKPEC